MLRYSPLWIREKLLRRRFDLSAMIVPFFSLFWFEYHSKLYLFVLFLICDILHLNLWNTFHLQLFVSKIPYCYSFSVLMLQVSHPIGYSCKASCNLCTSPSNEHWFRKQASNKMLYVEYWPNPMNLFCRILHCSFERWMSDCCVAHKNALQDTETNDCLSTYTHTRYSCNNPKRQPS